VTADVQQLLDERAIREVLLRYCRGVDRLELDLVRDCYHPDAIDDHGSFRGGVDEYLAWIGRLLPRYEVTMHLLGNTLVEFSPDRPDVARVETYGVAIHQKPGGAPELNLTIEPTADLGTVQAAAEQTSHDLHRMVGRDDLHHRVQLHVARHEQTPARVR